MKQVWITNIENMKYTLNDIWWLTAFVGIIIIGFYQTDVSWFGLMLLCFFTMVVVGILKGKVESNRRLVTIYKTRIRQFKTKEKWDG